MGHSLAQLLLLSLFSRVRLCAIPWTAVHQASPSLGFSRQEHWSGLPFPSPIHESEKWKWSRSVSSDSSDPTDCSPPGSSVHGIFQARVLEWGAIAFSKGFVNLQERCQLVYHLTCGLEQGETSFQALSQSCWQDSVLHGLLHWGPWFLDGCWLEAPLGSLPCEFLRWASHVLAAGFIRLSKWEEP